MLVVSHRDRPARLLYSGIGECARLREAMGTGSIMLARFCVHEVLNFDIGLRSGESHERHRLCKNRNRWIWQQTEARVKGPRLGLLYCLEREECLGEKPPAMVYRTRVYVEEIPVGWFSEESDFVQSHARESTESSNAVWRKSRLI